MRQHKPLVPWQVGLRQLLLTVTTGAIARGAFVSDPPLPLKAFVLSAPSFWAGAALLTFGAAFI